MRASRRDFQNVARPDSLGRGSQGPHFYSTMLPNRNRRISFKTKPRRTGYSTIFRRFLPTRF